MSDSSSDESDDHSSISTGSLYSLTDETFFNYFDPIYKTPFYDACVSDNIDSAKEILQSGIVNVNRMDNRGDRFLHTAVRNDSYKVVRLLLSVENIEINNQNFEGNTPLHYVKSTKVFDMLISAGCDLEKKNNWGCTPLQAQMKEYIILSPRIKLILSFIKSGANIHVDDGQSTLIHDILMAPHSTHEKEELIAMMLYFGADVNYKIWPTWPSPFMSAVRLEVPLSIIELMYPYVTDFNEVTDEHIVFYMMLGKFPHIMEILTKSCDCSYATDNNSCLFLALFYPDITIFEYIWNHCDLKEVFRRDKCFLYNYLRKGFNISKEDYFKYLYKLLSPEYGVILMQNYIYPRIYQQLINVFDEFQLDKNDRVKVMYTVLSLFGKIPFINVFEVYCRYGFDEEFEAFLNVTVEVEGYEEIDPNLRYICFPQESNRPTGRGIVPSLAMLARDAHRQTLRKPKNNIYFQYYSDVQKLDIPQVVKDIICYKRLL